MKTIVICALALVALVTCDDEVTQKCEPGATKTVECNSCFCIADGSGWACTQVGCSVFQLTPVKEEDIASTTTDSETEVQAENETCETGATKMIDCNSCRCFAGGWACTKKGCN